jgi:hypothetical protein
MARETWSAPARRKIAPGQANRLTGCAICKELSESRYTQHLYMNVIGGSASISTVSSLCKLNTHPAIMSMLL